MQVVDQSQYQSMSYGLLREDKALRLAHEVVVGYFFTTAGEIECFSPHMQKMRHDGTYFICASRLDVCTYFEAHTPHPWPPSLITLALSTAGDNYFVVGKANPGVL